MKLEAKQILELVGITAVVLSLLFVASELRLSNEIAIRESREAILTAWNEMSRLEYENPDITAFHIKLRDSSQTLNDEEKARAQALVRSYMSVAGLINSSYGAGMLPPEVLDIHLGVFRNFFSEYPHLVPHFKSVFVDVPAYRSGTGTVFDMIFQELEQR